MQIGVRTEDATRELSYPRCPVCHGRQRLDNSLAIVRATKAGETLQRVLKRYRQALFVFLVNRDRPPTNKGAKQGLRPCVVYRKVTNGFRSEYGAKLRDDICSVLETARRGAIDPLTAIFSSLGGRPAPVAARAIAAQMAHETFSFRETNRKMYKMAHPYHARV